MPQEARGFFITFEGPEGSGKSSQARRLVRALRRAGCRVVMVNDPGSTVLGRQLRTVLLHESHNALSSLAEALLFIAGRVALVEEQIRPALRKRRVVGCDRFHDSTMAYQGFGGRLDIRWLDQIGRRAIGGLVPDLTVLLDVPTAVGFARLRHRKDRMERKARMFHERVRRGFHRIALKEPRRIVVIDATQATDVVHRQILARVVKRLARTRPKKGGRFYFSSEDVQEK